MGFTVEDYCELIVQCLIRYGGVKEGDARRLLQESRICEVETEADRKWLFHEFAYYWAMLLLHAKENPKWHRDPKLWPPPEGYHEWVADWFRNRLRQ